MPKSKVFLSKSERKELSKKIKSRPRQANGRFLPKYKQSMVLGKCESHDCGVTCKNSKCDTEVLESTPIGLYVILAVLCLFLFGLVVIL